MIASQWAAVSALLDQALALAPDERADWLALLQRSDPEHATTVVRLLGDPQMLQFPSALALTAFDAALHTLQRGAWSANQQALQGRRLGAWQLDEKIGEGGMGQVWLARRADGLYDAKAAIKLLRDDVPMAQLSARFARERSALARLNHPNVAKLLDAGVDADGGAYIVLEYVPGRLLAAHLAAACPTVASRLRLALEIGAAVQHAHAQLIVHRDLKPGNVVVTEAGTPKLLDFGIAALLLDSADTADAPAAPPVADASAHQAAGTLTAHAGQSMTVGYAAPEQVAGGPVSVATDVYALGVMLFEMLSGRLPVPVEGRSQAQAGRDVLQSIPPALRQAAAAGDPDRRPTDWSRIDADLEAVLARALRKRPSDRYASVNDMMADVRRWLARRPVSAGNNERWHRGTLWLRRNALFAGLAACAVSGLATAAAVGTWQWQRAQTAARTANSVADALVDMLAGADPDQNGGAVPSVLQLLDKSRQQLARRLADEPAAQARLDEVLATTYDNLHRDDLALPLTREWIALAARAFGEGDRRTLDARLVLLTIESSFGPWRKVIADGRQLRPRVAAAYGERSEKMRGLLVYVAMSHLDLGQTGITARMLREVETLTAQLYPPDDFERTYLHRYASQLKSAQGQFRQAREELRATETAQRHPHPEDVRWVLALQRDALALDVTLGTGDHVDDSADHHADHHADRGSGDSTGDSLDDRIASLRARGDRLLGPGNELLAGLTDTLAEHRLSLGDFAGAAAADAAVPALGASLAPMPLALAARARRVWRRCLAQRDDDAHVRADVVALLDAVRRIDTDLGTSGVDTLLALARSALKIGDAALAGQVLDTLRHLAAEQLRVDPWTASRVAQVQGEWCRSVGALTASRALLQQRVTQLLQAGDGGLLTTWSAMLDLAYTLALSRDPQATGALAAAAANRPPQLAAGHPLDRVQRGIAGLLAHAPTLAPVGDPYALVGIF